MIPVSKDQTIRFTPATLANMADPPVFLFRPATTRDAYAFQGRLIEEGLRAHDMDQLRARQRAAIREHFTPEEADEAIPQLQAVWDSLDQNVPIDAETMKTMVAFVDSLTAADAPLRKMLAQNEAFSRDAPRLALGLLLKGWEHLPSLRFRRLQGVMPIEVADELAIALMCREHAAAEAGIEGIVPGSAFDEICTHALNSMSLTMEERGKSKPLSSSPSDPNGSTTAGGTAASSSEKSEAGSGEATPPTPSPESIEP